MLDVVQEEHQTGEWWIDEDGSTTYADGDVGDRNHEGIVIETLVHEILYHFDIDVDEPGGLSEYESLIKRKLMDDNRLSEKDMAMWENSPGSPGGPSEVILNKIIEDGAYKTPEQATDALYIAYGSTSRDARNYAMKYWRWKIMKTFGGSIEIQTWNLKPEDLEIIVKGVWEIIDDSSSEDPEDDDNKIGEDGYPGPRINVTVQALGKRYSDIPLAVLEKKLPTALQNYKGTEYSNFREGLNEDYHHLHKEFRLYEGNNKIVAIFEDNSRLSFGVHYREKHGMDREKWRRKAFTTWKSLANEIHSDVTLSEVGNPIQKTWKESFQEALHHPKLQEFIDKYPTQNVFEDKGYPSSVQGKPQICMDPVNFTMVK